MTPIIVLLVILNYQIPKFILESVLGIKYGTSILYDLVMWFFIIFGNILSVRKVYNILDFKEMFDVPLKETKEQIENRENRERLIREQQIKKYEAERLEIAVNTMRNKIRKDYLQRVEKGEVKIQAGMIYINLIHSLEKICDHIFNISEAIVGEK